jgi:predicted dehydrogenase
MKALLDGEWSDALLDPHRGAGDLRVAVLGWMPLAPVDGLHFRRPRSLRLVWNYVREIGLGATLTKIASRREERHRNEVFVAVGVGRVLESPAGSALAPGAIVELVAPRHPACVERVVLHSSLARATSPALVRLVRDGQLALLAAPASVGAAREVEALAGWTAESGVRVAPGIVSRALDRARALLEAANWQTARFLDVARATEVVERTTASPAPAAAAAAARLGRRARPPAVEAALFGYGNYAKTAILPSLPREVEVVAIHEVDPLQMPRRLARGGVWDTSPGLREDERFDAVFVAGFHHTHAALAVAALERGAVAVVEKPVATTEQDLAALLKAARLPGRRLFSCFHKRYSALNALVRRDLRVAPGDPVSYHCIVYEVPLPARHWYRWPRSRGRVVSNGCHWLDHFLFLNDFADVRWADCVEARDGTVSCSVELANGAFFTMALTDRGSERLGVQDHVELRANGVTVTIDNGWRYRAEAPDRVLRTRRANRLDAYRCMYRAIGRALVEGREGDSVQSI